MAARRPANFFSTCKVASSTPIASSRRDRAGSADAAADALTAAKSGATPPPPPLISLSSLTTVARICRRSVADAFSSAVSAAAPTTSRADPAPLARRSLGGAARDPSGTATATGSGRPPLASAAAAAASSCRRCVS